MVQFFACVGSHLELEQDKFQWKNVQPTDSASGQLSEVESNDSPKSEIMVFKFEEKKFEIKISSLSFAL
jgi:hypothetical protein